MFGLKKSPFLFQNPSHWNLYDCSHMSRTDLKARGKTGDILLLICYQYGIVENASLL